MGMQVSRAVIHGVRDGLSFEYLLPRHTTASGRYRYDVPLLRIYLVPTKLYSSHTIALSLLA